MLEVNGCQLGSEVVCVCSLWMKHVARHCEYITSGIMKAHPVHWPHSDVRVSKPIVFIGSECIAQVYLSSVSFMRHVIEVFPQHDSLVGCLTAVLASHQQTVESSIGLAKTWKDPGALAGLSTTNTAAPNQQLPTPPGPNAQLRQVTGSLNNIWSLHETWKTPKHVGRFDHCGWPQTSHHSLGQTVYHG